MLFESNIADDANKHLQTYETVKNLHDAYDNIPRCPECGHKEIDHSSANNPPGCWDCGYKKMGNDNIKNANSKTRVIGPCSGKNCGHCRYLNETIKELNKTSSGNSIPFEDVETIENLKRVLDLHKKGRNI